MKMYFSGLASPAEAAILQSVGVRDCLTDPDDWSNMMDIAYAPFRCALDSGAYRAFKAGAPLEVDAWMNRLRRLSLNGWTKDFRKREPRPSLDFVTMPDVLGDHEATWARWNDLMDKRIEYLDDGVLWIDKVIPVWQWGAPIEHLESMIRGSVDYEQRNTEFGFDFTTTIAVGGCVPWMREKDTTALARLVEICQQHGKWLHILGLNWIEAIEQLDPLVRSCDTSKWIDGARYGDVIINEGGKLIQQHKRMVGMASATREELMASCAKALNDYCNNGVRTETGEARPKGRTYTMRPGRKYEARNPAAVEAKNTFNMLCSEADIRRRQLRQANLL